MVNRPSNQASMSWHNPLGGWRAARYVEYADLGFDAESGRPSTAIMLARYAPGAIVPVHSHGTAYVSILAEGALDIGGETHTAGDIRCVAAKTAYGPLTAGPDGCIAIDIFAERDHIMRTSRPGLTL